MIFFRFSKKIVFLGILGPPYCGIGATFRSDLFSSTCKYWGASQYHFFLLNLNFLDGGYSLKQWCSILVIIQYTTLRVYFSLYLYLRKFDHDYFRFSNIFMSTIGQWRQGGEKRVGQWLTTVSQNPTYPTLLPTAGITKHTF